MRFTFEQAVEAFHQRIYYAANRFAHGSLAPDDLYQEILIAITSTEFRHCPSVDRFHHRQVDYNPSHVNAFIDSRAMDLARYERRRQSVRKTSDAVLDRRPCVGYSTDLRIDLTDALAELPDVERESLLLLSAPDDRTIAVAERCRHEALADRARGRTRMNVHKTKVTLSHVAEVMGVSKATVSRAAEHARSVLVAKLADYLPDAASPRQRTA